MTHISTHIVKLLLKALLGIDPDPRLVELIVELCRTSYVNGQTSILAKLEDTEEPKND